MTTRAAWSCDVYRGAYRRIDVEYCDDVERCFPASCITTSEVKASRTSFTSLATVLTLSQCYKLHVDVEVSLLLSWLKLRSVARNIFDIQKRGCEMITHPTELDATLLMRHD